MPPTRARRAAPRGRPATAPSLGFGRRLVLSQWLLGLFGVERFEQLAEHLRDPALEGLDADNVHRLHHALAAHTTARPEIPDDLLLRYDQHIVRHTQRLNERRVTRGEVPVVWKYFQYLALLFAEVYLDRYFDDPRALLLALNAHIARFNADREPADQVAPFDEAADAAPQLNTLALWCATGSGKTLLMHVNLLQYQHYLAAAGRTRDLNRIILLTPNPGLSQQHLDEFAAAGIEAELFDAHGRGLFAGRSVEILEVTRLGETTGERRVAVEAFEGNNLVLVDEGHRGASAGEEGAWMRARAALSARGFSFEYSATFGQAVKGNPALASQYARSILLDYSYRYFYADGFGKDYHILNLDGATQQQHLELYLTACLLTFFQQQRLYRAQRAAFRPFGLEAPLWVFVGSSVTKTLGARDASDVVNVLQFLARYAHDRAGAVGRIRHLLSRGLETASGRNLLAGRFAYLNTAGLTAEQVYDESLATLFNAPAGGQLTVQNLQRATGELALRLGAENPPFGVVNVGDDRKLLDLCARAGLTIGATEFGESLFRDLNAPASPVNVLVGSRKFSEGWNSRRVSTMALMNVGSTEGSQIIQLFGRGVRLAGYGGSLKRSARAPLPPGVTAPKYIGVLETLAVFGIQADYMERFREFLAEEGLPGNEQRVEVFVPVWTNLDAAPLKTVRLKDTINGVPTGGGVAFRTLGPVPTLGPPTDYLEKNPVVLNWYPRARALGVAGEDAGDEATPNEAHLSPAHVACLDADALYLDLERFRTERGWSNLNVTRSAVVGLLRDQSWYRLLIPADDLRFDSYDRVRVWQEIAGALLRKYVERFYSYSKRAWELPHLEYATLGASDPNLLVRETPGDGGYRVVLDASHEELAAKLGELKAAVEARTRAPLDFQGVEALWFGQHLYEPLLYFERKVADVSPVPLNKGERRFVDDLRTFYDANPAYFSGKRLHLLRNLSRGRGLGFFEAGNFYPDFILWLATDHKQYVSFVDPKGLRQVDPGDPKVEFYRSVKEVERRLADGSVVLNAFLVSPTPSRVMRKRWRMEKAEMQARNVLFQDEDQTTYVEALLNASTR